MESNAGSFLVSIERFKPHTFYSNEGDGLFISHSHGYDELTLILGGEGYYSSPKQNIKVEAGDLILIPPGLHHGFVCTVPWNGISVHFRQGRLPIRSQYLFQHNPEPVCIRCVRLSADDLEWAAFSFDRMERERRAERAGIDSESLAQIAFETALLLFQRSRDSSADTTAPSESIMAEVLREIHAGFRGPLTVQELAARHFLSESHLRKKFAETVGVSPKPYIIGLRLMEAKRLLQETDKAIETIAAEVGFTSSSRFYDYFIKSVGSTPLVWRKQARLEAGA